MESKGIPIYCDESCFTGENLLHDEQTIFSYASISCDEIEAEELPKSDEKIPILAQEKHNPFIK